MKLTKKIIAVFLSILTLFSVCSLSTTVFAAEYTEQKAITEYFDSALSEYLKNIVDIEDAVRISEKEQVDEVVEEANSSVARNVSTFSLRATPAPSTETAKEAEEDLDIDHTRITLELEDGENVAYLFSEPVSFIDDEGNLVYKDTNIKAVNDATIINRGYSYENGDNDYKAYFSEDSSKGLLLVEKDGEEIRLVPNGTPSVGTVEQIESDMELVDSFEYAGVYGTDSVLRFLPQLNGCKEEIVLSSYQGISDFSFTLYTEEGTIAAINSKGEVEIIDSATKDIITTFVAPFANDSSGGMDVTSEHYTDCVYELEMISEGKYILTISVPEEYLESESTVYPVIIDPTTDNISMTYDTSVYSVLKDSPQSSNPTACFGKTGSSQYGKGRAMFKFKIPSDIEDYAKISSAKLWLRETTGRTETMYVRPYVISESWDNSVTWNTKPAYKSTITYPTKSDLVMPRKNINSASTDKDGNPYLYAFDIIYAVKSWTTNHSKNYGLVFIAECEASDGDYLWRAFATKEHTTSSYRPYAVIKYTNDVTQPEISEIVKSNNVSPTNKNVKLTVTASDNVYKEGGISKYSFDNGSSWQTSNIKEYTKDGTYTPKVIAKDLAGNNSDTQSVSKFIIDKTAPKISQVNNPANGVWKNTNVTVKITATDNLSGVASYSFDNGSNWQTSNSKTYSSNGTYTITAKAKDNATNVSSAVSGGTVKIDKSAPSVSTVSGNPTSWTSSDVTLTVTATDTGGSGVAYYSFDNGSTWQTSNAKTFSTNQTVYIKVKDAAGNISAVRQEIISKIDKTAPTASVSSTSTSASTKVTVTASDALSGLHSTPYSFDGGSTWQESNTKIVTSTTTLSIKVRDKAGNIKTLSHTPSSMPINITPSITDWTNKNVRLTVTGTGISQYKFDSGSYSATNYKDYSANTTASITVKDSNDKTKTVTYKITNIDKANPVISDVTRSETEWTNDNVTITVNASDVMSGLADTAYSFDGGITWQEDNTYTASENGTFNIIVKDKAGNETTWDEIVIDNIDKEVPSSPDLYEQDGLVYISSRSFDFNEETDSPEHIEYKIENGEWTEYDGEPINIVRTYGATVYARVVDAAHNGEDGSNVTSITLENNLGEYTASYTDIALGEGLFPVEFGRTYTSTNGWFFTFDANIAKIDDNSYVFTDFYGEKQYFIKNSEGKYLSIDEEELTVNSDSYVLTYGDMTCTFGLNGKINRIVTDYLDTQYTWNDDGTLTITGGATVTFDTDGNPTNINITRTGSEGTAHTKEVDYVWTEGNLTKFIDAADVEHIYAYDENGLLTINDTETITYFAEGRVKLISQPNGSFVNYLYNDTAANTEIPNNIGAVTVRDSKGVTDTWYYADGVYISNTLDSYSDNAQYDPDLAKIAAVLEDTTEDIISPVAYVVEELSEDESADETSGETDETASEDTATDETAAEEEATADESETEEEEVTEETVAETPLYKEIDENIYAFYAYDEQDRVSVELRILKTDITIDENTTFEDAEAVAESKATYSYLNETDIDFDVKECYTYINNGNVLTHSKYKYIGEDEILLYDESYEYNDCGNVATHTETQYATDVDAFDITYTTSYTYDVWGMCTGTTVTCGEDVDTTITEYDINGVTLSVTYNDEKVVYTYTDFGTVDKETVVKLDGETQTVKQETDYTYDAVGNLISCLNPDGDTSYYEYDDYGNLTNHNFNGYFFTYNTLGSILTASVNDDVLVTYTYESAEQELSSVQYANGQTLNYAYDEATGDLLTVSQGETAKFSYSYSTVGKDEIITLTDSINSIIKVIENDKVTVKTSDGKTDIYSVESLYEEEETPGSFTGKKITVGSDIYTLKSEENKDSFYVGETEAFVKTYENDYAGNLWKVNIANAVSTQYGYNENKNISTLKNTLNGLVQTFGYGYDDEGNITTETLNIVTSDEVGATVETNEAVHYEYDEDNQLVKAYNSTTEWNYSYDNRGNITSKSKTDLTTNETVTDNYAYDTVWLDKLTSYNGQTITYDAVGNPIEYLGHNLEWSFGRQLTKFDTNTYTYNEDGIRTSKTVGGITTTYYLDGTNIIEQNDGTNTLHFHYDSNDEVIGFTYNEADYFYVKNSMSDIIGLVDDGGNLIVSYVYDAWGKVLSVTGSNVELGNLNPFRYRSYYYDSDIEMYYLQSRYYDPEVCRFINSDDVNYIGLAGTVGSYNAFAYCENNPVNNSDPSGCIAANIVGAVILGIIGAVGGYFLSRWIASKIYFRYNWQRNAFIAGLTAVITVSAAAIGYFIGPYVAKFATKLGQYVVQLIKNGKITLRKLSTNAKSSIKSLLKQTCCFVKGTFVSTPHGLCYIENIKVGDSVYAANPETGEVGIKKVVEVFVKETYTLYHVITETEEIVVTNEHPFWVVEIGWVEAEDLKKGDVLLLQNGKTMLVLETIVENLEEPVFVYNFEVEDWHTYFVGKGQILVHNKCNLTRISDSYLKRNKLDAHAIKKEVLGRNAPIAQYDLFYDKTTGAIFILKKGAQAAASIATGYVIK